MNKVTLFAASLALLVVGAIHADAKQLTTGYGFINGNPEHVCVQFESNDKRTSDETCLFKEGMTELSEKRFNDISHVIVVVSSAKGEKKIKLSFCRAKDATNEIPLKKLRDNPKYSYLVLTKDAHGRLALEAIHASDLKNYQITGNDYTCAISTKNAPVMGG